MHDVSAWDRGHPAAPKDRLGLRDRVGLLLSARTPAVPGWMRDNVHHTCLARVGLARASRPRSQGHPDPLDVHHMSHVCEIPASIPAPQSEIRIQKTVICRSSPKTRRRTVQISPSVA